VRCASFAVVAGLLVMGAEIGAQEVRDPRVGLAVSGGVASVPDALGAQCGRNGGGSGGGVEASGAVVVRPWRWMIVQGDTRVVQQLVPNGCTLVLFALDTSYAASGRREPFTTSTLRAGVETPRGMPLVRATAGIGRVWGSPTLPVTMLGVAAGTRGRRVRFLVEAERLQTRVPAEEVRNDFPQPARRRPIVVRPVWHSVRLGVELPLVG
jgi:hypothetical protein